jgi:hypothetical protein
VLEELLELLMLLDRRVRTVACVAAEEVVGASSGDASFELVVPEETEEVLLASDEGYD